ncbi:threonine synthase [Christensenella sp. MSJ-20]|uniref:threonine synthase n=1 Tax=Christensenella sp. MSJ-20 TaxID=2841518 RepID=UPI001C789C81|nr:threonine synthase [Christensenella sp. MSJ-20]
MQFFSTRGGEGVSPAEAVLMGIAPDGGLFIPEAFPQFSLSQIAKMARLSYPELSAQVIASFLTDFTYADILKVTREGYAAFSHSDTAPLVSIGDGLFGLELFHGPTLAFKDIALCVLPGLMRLSMEKLGQDKTVLILVATSGDTGKAALSGFTDKPGTAICVYYPKDGVSYAQKRQMITQKGKNVQTLGVEGDFDACQRGVKAIMGDPEMARLVGERGYAFSSANSINFGRLVPQVAYYFSSYVKLLSAGEIELGDQVDFIVPTGNFGNILAGWYAKQMGLPVGKLICASNRNNVLTKFFSDGVYRAGGTLHKTTSPSMDILVSSNLERLLYHCTQDPDLVKAYMEDLAQGRDYAVGNALLNRFSEDFLAGWADDAAGAQAIGRAYRRGGYVLDPHSAIGRAVYEELPATGNKAVLVCTASPFKFSSDVLRALGREPQDDESAPYQLADVTGLKLPMPLIEALTAEPRLLDTCGAAEMGEALLAWLDRAR